MVLKTMNRKVFWVCLIASLSLIVGGFFVPPLGVIDGSVLTAVGEILGFVALNVLLLGLDKGTDVTVRKGDFEVELDAHEGETPCGRKQCCKNKIETDNE